MILMLLHKIFLMGLCTVNITIKTKINEFLDKVDVVTYEFENIPYETLHEINKIKPVLPKPSVNRIIQHRLAEKDFINNLNIRTTQICVD